MPDSDERLIYLDHHSTTPMDHRVLEAMLPYFRTKFGNASSTSHRFGQEAGSGVAVARQEVAGVIGARPSEILFTSGATESDNLALKGVMRGSRSGHLVTVASEHKAVLDAAQALRREGHEVTILNPNPDGTLNLDLLAGAIRPNTVLVSVMAANNEVGTVYPLKRIGEIVRQRGALFHTDASQGLGRVPLHVGEMNIDLMSISAHKVYGPKGIGALYVRRKLPVDIEPLIHGGGHEHGLRSGTLNVAGCVGLGRACVIAADEMAAESTRLSQLRDRLWQRLAGALPGITVNGHVIERLPGNLNVAFDGVDAETLMARIPDIAVSSGSACTSAAPGPSHVLRAMGLSHERAESSIRFGLGRLTTEEEIDYTAERFIHEVNVLREVGTTRTGAATPGRVS